MCSIEGNAYDQINMHFVLNVYSESRNYLFASKYPLCVKISYSEFDKCLRDLF